MVWEIIEGQKDGIGAYEIVQGCVDDWKWHTGRPGGEPVDVMAGVNMAIAARMAGRHIYLIPFAQSYLTPVNREYSCIW